MLFHSYIFWGTIRKDIQFKVIIDHVNEISADMTLNITHISYESNAYDSKTYRKYNRVSKKLLNFNEFIDDISLLSIASTGKESDYLYEYEAQFGFLNKILVGMQGQNDVCDLTIKKEYLNDIFKLRVLPKFNILIDYMFDKVEYQHVTCKSRVKASTYIFDYQRKNNSKSINILEREIYK